MDFSFLNKVKSTLEGLFNRGKTNSNIEPLKVAKQPEPTPTPTPIQQAPEIAPAMEFAQSQMPQSSPQTPEEYYPLLGDDQFVQGAVEADKLRQGLGTLLLLQAFFESTLGRNEGNPFGVKPPGGRTFENPSEALDYQLGPNVLGGGANPNMNILDENTPLTSPDVEQLYQSYNPGSSYLQQLLSVMFPQDTSEQIGQ
jgi:hypothetical protein